MHPQFTAHQLSAHARVSCVECHVGSGASWYVKSKVSGTRQVFAAAFNTFPRPIPTPIHNLRPAQDTCEQCHWPKKFYGGQLKVFTHYSSDEANTPRQVRLLINTGGGDPATGAPEGIHWHMNIANKVEYIAMDEQRLTIPWVRITDPQGVVTEYRTAEFTDDPARHQIRRMDCMDCHSRPAHKVHPPNDAVDLALSTGRLDPKTPWIKSKAVTALVQPYKTKGEAEQGIANSLREAYKDSPEVSKITNVVQQIYRENFFPEVNTDWRSHPDFVGHKNWNGCFRCHDGKHVSADGQKSIKASDCKACHLILAQGNGEALNQVNPQGHEFIHIDSPYSDFSCTDCHTGGLQKE
jgi:hypothetical protein